MDNRPQGRERNVRGQGADIYKRGSGLGAGPVGTGQAGRPTGGGSGGGGKRSGGGRSPLMTILIAAILLFGGGGVGLGSLLGGSSGETAAPSQSYVQSVSPSASGSASGALAGGFGNLLADSFSGASAAGWTAGNNTGRLNTAVASAARAKRTTILGGGRDTVTLMVYLCGTDLESKYGMGTADLQEMAAATLSDRINLIVCTGGCKQWKNNTVSNSVNQIYKVESGGLRRLESSWGSSAMTAPENLAKFIRYCAKNYPANRNELILWDHGGGSLSGYGYDEKNVSTGSMSLAGIDSALKSGGVSFDFVGFDACLMATLENALMLADHADYLIASEETEPGVGWYYTNWLTELSKNTSMPTVEIGRLIADDFVGVCAQKCRGQDTTLSVVDLAELEATVPESFRSFAADTLELQSSDFKAVSNARRGAREFAASSRIDQVDLVHLASNLDTQEGKALSDALLGAVKYNRTSNTVSNAYGLSIYFPYQKTSKVGAAAKTYDAIGMDDEYTRCIQQFASMGAAGQATSASVSGYAGSPLNSLLGVSSGGGVAGGDLVSQMLLGVLSSGLYGRSLDTERAAAYLTENQFDASQLVWVGSDEPRLVLSEEQWSLVNDLKLSVFYDDGEGYIDLGLDSVFTFTDDGALLGSYDGAWLAVNGRPVPYYHTATTRDDGAFTMTGYVPILLNGERAELLITFEANDGYVSGVRMVYDESASETVAKAASELTVGDRIDFVCDYYGYDGSYQDSYLLGETWVYDGEAEVYDVTIDASRVNAAYRFTDVYGQNYWTPLIPQ